MTAEATATAGAPPAGRDILGHPRGLWYLTFAEFWERFSYYGMNGLLVLYLTQYLLLPEHVGQVAGFGLLKGVLEGMYGPLATPIAIGTAITAVYTSGVYVTPIIGGLIADHVLGRTATVSLGAILMVIGHFLMAFEASFVIAIACLFVGVGCFKGNIASQVGELYARNDLRRADAFQTYMLGIQLAVIVTPWVCGYLGEKVAWHWGFGAAGIGILGLIIYLSGRKYLPAERKRGEAREKAERAPLTGRDWLTLLVLVAMLPVLALCALSNQQIFNAYEVWGGAHYDRDLFGFELPVTSLLSLDAIISTALMFSVIVFWRWYGKTRKEPDEIIKIIIGSVIAACGPLMLAFGAAQEAATGHKVSLLWGVGYHVVNDLGFAMVFPVGLALFSRASPKALGGMVMGIYYLHLAMANLGTGVLGGMLEKMSGFDFWLLHSGLVGLGAALLIVFALLFHKILAPSADAAAAP
ncbi:MAG TPA: MFS transporter [Caulobacterales bacterium]|nr:MFS transporter [Caulobacterales bacterium]